MKPPTRRSATATLLLVAILFLSACSGPDREPYRFESSSGGRGFVSDDGAITTVARAERGRAPRIVGRDLNGELIDTKTWRGRVVVINIWGSWCPPCRREAPVLNAVAKKTRARGVEFLGIAVREDATASRAFAERVEMPYPSLSDPAGQQLLGFADTLPAIAVPTTYVIDRRGRVAARVLDEVTEPTLSSLVDDVLGEER